MSRETATFLIGVGGLLILLAIWWAMPAPAVR